MVVIARDITRFRALNFAWYVRKNIPDRRGSSILGKGPFDLIAGSGCSPQERCGGLIWAVSRHKQNLSNGAWRGTTVNSRQSCYGDFCLLLVVVLKDEGPTIRKCQLSRRNFLDEERSRQSALLEDDDEKRDRTYFDGRCRSAFFRVIEKVMRDAPAQKRDSHHKMNQPS